MSAAEALSVAINQVAARENFKDPKIVYNETEESGYMAKVSTAKIKSKDDEINMFVKVRPTGDAKRDFLTQMVFNVEQHFYNAILPAFRAFENSKNVSNPLQCVPKCFYAEEGIILLEDMHTRGYTIWEPLIVPLDHDHIVSVCKEYGRFHALSMEFIKQQPEETKELIGQYPDSIQYIVSTITSDFFYDTAKKAAAGFSAEEKKISEKFLAMFTRDGINKYFENFPQDKSYNVLVHGDCWSHNYIFKEGDNLQTCLLDFQVIRQSTPIVDLSYFFCTSACSKEVFDNIDTYLKIYHDSLSDYLRELGVDPDERFPFEAFKQQWKRHGTYGLYWANWINKMMVASKEEMAANRSDKGFFYGFNFISKNEAIYQKKMRDSIMYFYENDMFPSY